MSLLGDDGTRTRYGLTHLSLFSGIGGIDLAAEWAGFETVAFVERDPYCQRVLAKHWPEVPIYGDVTTFDGTGFRGVDLLSGGFPCQPYSQAGKRRGSDDDRALWPAMLRIIRESQPAWVVGENVAGFVGMGLDACLSDLESEGYEARAFVLPACGVGAPHQRYRVFVVAHSRSGGRDKGSASMPGQAGGPTLPGNPGETVADSYATRQQQSCGVIYQERRRTGDQGEGVTDANDDSSGRENLERGAGSARANGRGEFSSSHPKRGRGQWEFEPNVGRVAHGVSRRVDRLRALGNAVVPQQVYPILKAIANAQPCLEVA